MNQIFREHIEALEPKFQQLIGMTPVTMAALPSKTPQGGIYLFSENQAHLYVGRTKRFIHTRVKGHVGTEKDAPLAFRIAREMTGNASAAYFGDKTRDKLLADPLFAKAYTEAKQRIRLMHLRYVEESDPIKQTLLEIYAAVVLNTPYNDFDTH